MVSELIGYDDLRVGLMRTVESAGRWDWGP